LQFGSEQGLIFPGLKNHLLLRYACWFLAVIQFSLGCRISTPVFVWTTPRSNTSPQLAIAIGHIEGKPETAKDFERLFAEQRPSNLESIAVVGSDELVAVNPVQLASTAPPLAKQGEIGAIQAARQAGTDYVLMGETVRDELEFETPGSNLPPEIQAITNQSLNPAPMTARRPEHLTIAWRAIDAQTRETIANFSTSMDRHQADNTYPELVWQYPNPRDRVIAANAREAWKSIGPHVVQDKAKLAVSWGAPGSAEIRKGVVYAKAGRWLEAEQHWQGVVEKYPRHHKAWHNLAYAAAAREDFQEAKRCIKLALELSDNSHYTQTFRWIELRQRDYHAAFNLPEPPEGWAFPAPQTANSIAVDQVSPLDLDSEPWYRLIPGYKPPEWTWYAWLTQPLAL